MKKIGILYGQENTFPQAFVERINSKKVEGILAEPILLDKVLQAQSNEYAVIIDRISQDVPFYRRYLKNAAICGAAVINNPFWWSSDDKFFNNALAEKIGVPVPKTVLFPSQHRPDNTTAESFRNLALPLDFETIFNYVGFPAYFKPSDGGGWKHVYKVYNQQDFFDKYRQTGQLVMMLQEEIVFSDYFRCYCIGGKHVKIMAYDPRQPHHARYVKGEGHFEKSLIEKLEKIVLALNQYLGYDFNTVELAVRDGVPYAIDFCNPAPDADVYSVGEENFEWVVETSANYAIERALAHKDGEMNLTWGKFIGESVEGKSILTDILAEQETVKKSAPAKTKAKKEEAPEVVAETPKEEAPKKTTKKKK